MAANVDANLANWSTTEGSNQPDGTDAADIDAELRRMQAVVRKYIRNKGADIASATTTDLATATGDYVDITGTTTITGLGTVAAGMRFILQFDAALTLTHSASLVLPGAANITTAAGDHAIMESLGSGNWVCIFFTRASGAPTALDNDSVTYAKLQNVSASNSVIGRKTAGSGDAEECTLTDVLDMVGSAAEGDLLYRGTSTWSRLGKGTAGQVLQVNSVETAPEWATPNTPITAKTVQASTSGASIDFTSIPSNAKRVTVCFQGVSTNGNNGIVIQIGDSGGLETTGYLGACSLNGTSNGAGNYTDGFGVSNTASSAVLHGAIMLSNMTGNVWVAHGCMAFSNTTQMAITAGSKELSATLDRVSIVGRFGDNFDAGAINILYE